MKSSFIFLVVMTAGLLWLIQGRQASSQVLWPLPEAASSTQAQESLKLSISLQEGRFCTDFTFFQETLLQFKQALSSEVTLVLHSTEGPGSPAFQSTQVLQPSSQKRYLLDNQAWELSPDQKGDPWYERSCLLELQFQSPEAKASLVQVQLLRDSSGNTQVIIGLVSLLWLVGTLLFFWNRLTQTQEQDHSVEASYLSGDTEANEDYLDIASVDDILNAQELEDPQDQQWLQDILLILREEYLKPQTDLKSIAVELGLSQVKVDSLTEAACQSDVASLLEALRLAHAQQLLKDSGASIKEVAQASGYYSPNQLKKAFQKRFKISPSTYRSRV